MSAEVGSITRFRKDLKRLARKFRTLPNEVDDLITSLEKTPKQGKALGAGLYKIRLASKSKNVGKSGGFRVVTYYVEQIGDEETVYLVTIYDKSEEDTIAKADLLTLVKQAFDEELTEPEADND